MLYRYDVFDDMIRLKNVINNFFADIPGRSASGMNFPYINLYEKNDQIEIKALLPGVKAGDINLELTENGLVLEGERRSDIKEQRYIRNEREFGKFKKIIKLPYPVDRENIKAKLKNGILNINLVKSKEAKPKKIEIK